MHGLFLCGKFLVKKAMSCEVLLESHGSKLIAKKYKSSAQLF